MPDANVVISGTGVYHPESSISNAELVASFNEYVDRYRAKNKSAIAAGELPALAYSDEAFIEKASGIKSRYVVDKNSILDPDLMMARIPVRPGEQMSLQCDMSMQAAQQAMQRAQIKADDVDAVIVACSNLQRPYPAIAVELQAALGITGLAFDMNVACASAVFAVQQALLLIRGGVARSVLLCSPEICSAHMNFCDRNSHFIFGDATSAVLLQREDLCKASRAWRVEDICCATSYSNNIRNDFSFLSRAWPESYRHELNAFQQNGPKVFRDVVPWVSKSLLAQCERVGLPSDAISQLWLHQANANMNQLIAKKVLGRDIKQSDAPLTLQEFANTSSSGSIIAMHKHEESLGLGSQAILSAFGAGYSMASAILRCVH